MSNRSTPSEMNDEEEIHFWDLISMIKNGWHWPVGMGAMGALISVAVVTLLPNQYEAKVVVQPSTVGLIVPASSSTASPASNSAATEVEPTEKTLERLKAASFYDAPLLSTCQAQSERTLVEAVNASIIKTNRLLVINYRAKSPEIAQACLSAIVERLAQVQAATVKPLLSQLHSQRESTKQQLDELTQLIAQKEKRHSVAAGVNELSALMIKFDKDERARLEKLYRDQTLQLSEPLTQGLKAFVPVYVAKEPVAPKRLLIFLVSSMAGLFLGLLTLFVRQSWVAHRAMLRD